MLSTRYRPVRFSDILGQEVAKLLLQGILRQRGSRGIPSPIIFEGAFGSGKTTAARIFARALLCDQQLSEPCNQCVSCQSFLSDQHPGFLELDAASYGSKDSIEALKEELRFRPPAKMRIILWDEAQLFTSQAQNALLKILEDPPKNTVFLLASTELHRIIKTIRSRSFVLEFRPVSLGLIEDRLKNICTKESIDFEADALSLLAAYSKGHVRDAIVGLERASFVGAITSESVSRVLPVELQFQLLKLLRAIVEGDMAGVYSLLEVIFEAGFVRNVSEEFFEVLQSLLFFRYTGNSRFHGNSVGLAKEILKLFDLKLESFIREVLILRDRMIVSEQSFYLGCCALAMKFSSGRDLPKLTELDRIRAKSKKADPMAILQSIPGVVVE